MTRLQFKVEDVTSTTSKFAKEFNNFKKNPYKSISDGADTLKTKLNSLGDVIKKTFDLYIITRFAKALYQIGYKSLSEMSNFMENYNLFRVAMGSMSDDAMVFQNSMNSILGTDLSQSMRYQGFFQNLTTSLGIASKESLTLSTNLTKLTYDLSSLFNVPFEDMYSKLQSGMIGQTKPLRSVGIDVTMQTLQPYLNQMGIDKQVTQLTQAEKVLLRYIAILDQSSNAHGDFAITIEQPANQLKVLNNQVKEAYRWFGALFIGMFGSILPYINAFAMSLKEIFKSLAMFLGFKLPEFQSRDMGSDFEDMEESATGASGAISKLNRQMRSFDEINNISSSSDAGNTAIGSPSVYKELLEYITGYDNKMGEIKMKAVAIRDAVMKWLGYTKTLDGFKWNGFGTLFKNIKDATGIDIKPFAESLGKLVESAKSLANLVFDQVVLFYQNFLLPLADYVIEDVVPKSIDAVSEVIKSIVNFYKANEAKIIAFYKDFLLPLSKTMFDIAATALEGFSDILIFMLDFISKNEAASIAVFKALTGFISFLIAKSTIALLTAHPILAIIAAIAMIVGMDDELQDFFDGLSGWGKLVGILAGVALSIFAIAMAIAAVQSAWSLGIAAVAISAGIALMYTGIKSLMKDFDISGSIPNGSVPTQESGNYGRPGAGSGSSRPSNVPFMADGGFLSTGQMFIARESGPEMVGTIGGRSAVANNNDIVQSIKQGVYEANVLSENKQPIHLTVNVGSAKVEDSIIDMVNNGIARGKLVNV